MAGFYTPGLVQVGAAAVNGQSYSSLTGGELIPADTLEPGGVNPATVAISVFQLAAYAADLAAQTGTASAGAVTLSTERGVITSEALTTAIGGTYTLTLTNTLVKVASTVYAEAYNGTSTAGTSAGLTVTSITPAAGSVVIVVTNNSGAILNGTIKIAFQVF